MLLVDETSIPRRHRYVTVIQNGETGEVLAMVAHRNAPSLSGFLSSQGRRWCRGVKVVVTDGSRSYTAALQAHLGHATHVLDRFHVCRWFAAGATLVRRDVQRREPRGEVTPAYEPDLFRARFALLRRADDLDEEEAARLNDLFARYPRIGLSWAALQELYAAYTAQDKQGALQAVMAFCDLYETGAIPEFGEVVEAIINWGDQIIAFHHPAARRITNGRLEGTNNKPQVLRRVAHGFTNRANFEARGILITPAVPPSSRPRTAGFPHELAQPRCLVSS